MTLPVVSRLRIQHRTVYTYARPVALGRHRLILRPREGHDVRVQSMQLAIEPAHQMTWTRDVFGNSVAFVDFDVPAATLDIACDVIVDLSSPFPLAAFTRAWPIAYPLIYDSMEERIAHAYLLPTYPGEVELVGQWNAAHLPPSERSDVLEMLKRMCTQIHGQIRYLRRSEKGVQAPATTLHSTQGSCRDMATLMMEASRALGIASRFVTGYLHCAASIAGRASTHAWMEAYLPGLGWRGFDPTLGEAVSQKHISVGVSNHPRGVMPVSGNYAGDRADFKTMTVEVATTALDAEGPA